MFSRYSKLLPYFKALPLLYGAKRRAEVAPGVGKESDFFLITKNGTEAILREFIDIISAAYELEEIRKSNASLESEDQLTKFVRNLVEQERKVTDDRASDAAAPSLDQLATAAPTPPPEALAASEPAKIPPRSHRRRSPRRAR
jgi:hypothetical protein